MKLLFPLDPQLQTKTFDQDFQARPHTQLECAEVQFEFSKLTIVCLFIFTQIYRERAEELALF